MWSWTVLGEEPLFGGLFERRGVWNGEGGVVSGRSFQLNIFVPPPHLWNGGIFSWTGVISFSSSFVLFLFFIISLDFISFHYLSPPSTRPPQPFLQVTPRYRSVFPLNPFPRVIIKELSVTPISNSLSPSRLAGFCIWVTGVTARSAPLHTSRKDLTLARLTPLCTSGNDLTLARKGTKIVPFSWRR